MNPLNADHPHQLIRKRGKGLEAELLYAVEHTLCFVRCAAEPAHGVVFEQTLFGFADWLIESILIMQQMDSGLLENAQWHLQNALDGLLHLQLPASATREQIRLQTEIAAARDSISRALAGETGRES